MLSQNLLRNEVYLIENNEITIIYAPLTRYFSIYEGIISYGDIDDDWLVEATSMNNVPDFIKNKGFVFDKDKIRLRLNITSNCNLSCEFCSVKALKNGKDMPEFISFKAISYFSKFARLNKAKELEIVFSGGEPTLRISFI